MAETTQSERGGRLSGLVPLVVIGLIAFLFIRSCLGNFDLGFGLGGEDEEDRELPGTTEPVEDPESETNGSTLPEDDPEMATMLEPEAPECPAEDGEETRHLQWTQAPDMCIDPNDDLTAVLETSRGEIEIDLDTENAPVAANNFVFLARWGYYDGVLFHWVFPDDTAQAGDPVGQPPGTGGPGYTVEGELPAANVRPYYPRYSVAMGNDGQPGANRGVFFIVTGINPESPIPRNYSRIGRISSEASQEVVDAINDTGDRNDPQAPAETIIHGVTIREN